MDLSITGRKGPRYALAWICQSRAARARATHWHNNLGFGGTDLNKLETAREEISRIDEEMARLFERRMAAARLVAEHKMEHGLPILDTAREQALIERNSRFIDDPVIREYYVSFLQGTMDVSKRYQQRLCEGLRVAYSGVEGAFAHISAGRIFPTARLQGFKNFRSAYDAVALGECDCAVLPIENSFNGEVGEVQDLMFFGPLHVNGVYELTITQNLIGLPGTDLRQIRQVLSHPQALGQCQSFLHDHGWKAVEYANTALAAEHVARLGDPSVAAIASAETAELYGLEILEANINESSQNTTRFAVFSRAENRSLGKRMGDHFILVFTSRNEAGSLAAALAVLGKQYGFNMRTLRSRPVKELLWEYYFYLEAEGDIYSEKGEALLRDMAPYCDRLKVVGTFSRHVAI